VEDALLTRQIGVQPVAQLVGERQDVAPAGGPVEEHVGMVRRHGVRAERARSLAGTHRRVDPRLIEELLDDLGELR